MTDFDKDDIRKTTPPPLSQTEKHTSVNQPEVITPLEVTITKKKVARSGATRMHKVTFALIGMSFIVLLIGGLWLLDYLSKNPVLTEFISMEEVIPKPQPESLLAEIPVPESVDAIDTAQSAQEKENAEQKLADLLLAKQELDTRGVSEWGG